MNNYVIKAGTVDVSVVIRIIDSTDGTPETGVVFNTSGIDLEYRRELAASTDITEATLAALTTAHADGGFLHIGNGYYRLDLPDAAVAAGSAGCLVHGVVTGMVVVGAYIQLVAYDPFDTVRLGLTAMPNVASGSAGALIVSGTGTAALSVSSGLVTLAGVTHTGAVIPTVTTTTTATNVTTVNGLAANVITAAATAADFGTEVAAAVWQDAVAGDFTVASSIGKALYVSNVAPGAAGGHFIAGTNAATTITTGLTTTFTGNLTGSVGSVTGAVGSVTGAVGSVTGAVGSVTGAVGSVTGLTAATVHADLDDIQARLPAALTANGNMKSSMVEILTTALTETAGLLAGGFKKFFNIASPVSTMDVLARVTLTDTVTTYTGNTVQTGDSFARLGAAGAGLTAVPWNAAWDAEVQSEAADAITAAGLATGANVSAVETKVDGVKAKTDSLTFTVAGQVDANVQRINDVTITGDGQVGTEFGV